MPPCPLCGEAMSPLGKQDEYVCEPCRMEFNVAGFPHDEGGESGEG